MPQKNHPIIVMTYFCLIENLQTLDVVDYPSQRTPLHIAAMEGSTQKLALLVRQGANIFAKDIDQNTALHLALQNSSNSETIYYLIVTDKEFRLIGMKNYDDNTALHIAARYSTTEILQILIDNSKEFIEAKNKKGYTPLHMAAMASLHAEDKMELLIKNGANSFVKCNNGHTPSALKVLHY